MFFFFFLQTFIPENLSFFFHVTHIYQSFLLIRNNHPAIVKMEIQRGNSFQCFCDISPNLSTKKRKNFYYPFHLKTISLKQNLNIFIKSPNRNRTIFPKIISPSISKSFLSYPLPSPFRISIKPTSKPSSKEQNLNTIHHPPASFLHRSSRKNTPSPFLFFPPPSVSLLLLLLFHIVNCSSY